MRILRKHFSGAKTAKALVIAAIFLLAGAAFAQPAIEARSEPPNLDELKQQLLVYRNSGVY